MSLVPGNELWALQPGDVADPAGTNLSRIVVDGLPRGHRRVPVHNNGGFCHIGILILDEWSQDVATGAADGLREEITLESETGDELGNGRLHFYFDRPKFAISGFPPTATASNTRY